GGIARQISCPCHVVAIRISRCRDRPPRSESAGYVEDNVICDERNAGPGCTAATFAPMAAIVPIARSTNPVQGATGHYGCVDNEAAIPLIVHPVDRNGRNASGSCNIGKQYIVDVGYGPVGKMNGACSTS